MMELVFFNLKRVTQGFKIDILKTKGFYLKILLLTLMGKTCMASSLHVKIENLYYHIRIFEQLGKWFVFVTCLLLLISLTQYIFKNRFKKAYSLKGKIYDWFVRFGFFAFTIGLGIRWFLAGHAPWSNQYESMIFSAWACILAGIILSRHSRLPLTSGGLLAGVILLIAHRASIDSSFTPLPPVLKSKLMVTHVSIAITGYGFFSVGTALAFCNLLVLALHFFGKENNLGKKVLIRSKITEQALWFGLLLITLGSILGSIWANEAWGRYWGWDPKESWTLILILTYVLVLNLRLVIRHHWAYWLNVWSLFAFGALIMTYFGVNRFFSGMHTYGGQKGIQFTLILFWFIGIWIALSFLAYRNREIIKE